MAVYVTHSTRTQRLGSDIGHFDMIDFRDPVPEAHELVEKGLITSDDFPAFTFENAVRLWGTQNPRFLEGTVVAKKTAVVMSGRADAGRCGVTVNNGA